MEKLYFETLDFTICRSENYFRRLMKSEGLAEIQVYKAEKEKVPGMFWCKEYECVCEKGDLACGKSCEEYKPRNGIKGCCVHFTNALYSHGELTTLYL